MKTILISAAFILTTFSTGSTWASDLCEVPESEWQPIEALQTKLVEQGWDIKNIKIDDGCYEAYATDEKGERVEAYFNPKTFELVKSK